LLARLRFAPAWLSMFRLIAPPVEQVSKHRRAKAEAALRGRKLKDLVEEGLRLVLETPRKTRRHPGLGALRPSLQID
jgi:hypothetical protein